MDKNFDISGLQRPSEDEDNLILEQLQNYLSNGGAIPKDDRMVARLTLAGIREVYRRQAKLDHRQDVFAWFLGGMAVMYGSSIGALFVQHGQIWEILMRHIQAIK